MDKYLIEKWSNEHGRWLAGTVTASDLETTEKTLAMLDATDKETIYRMRKLDGAAYHQNERLF